MRALIGGLIAVLLAVETDSWACQKYISVVQDTVGNVVPGTTITAKIAGTSTLATLYSDTLCSATMANPLTSLSDGTFSFYTTDGRFDLFFVKSGYSFQPATDIANFEPFGVNVKSPADFQAPDDLCATGTGAIDVTGATVRTLYINTAVACTQDKTIPATLSIVFLGKGSVTVSVGKTLTVNGPVRNLTDHAVWLGSGTTVFGATAGANPYGKDGIVAATYSASMTLDASLGTTFTITPNDGTAFAVTSITRPAYNRRIRINIINTTGGALGAGTFTCCKIGAAWTQPATGFNRSLELEYTGSVWQEVNRSAADISN